jgi:hypothetical protein
MLWPLDFFQSGLLKLSIRGEELSFGQARKRVMVASARLLGLTFAPQKNLCGLGVISIHGQNSALLAKFLSKIHSHSNAPWVCWFYQRYGLSTSRDLSDHHHLDSPVWKDIISELQSYQNISTIIVGNSLSMALWSDIWIGNSTFGNRYPTLFSHSTRPNISVSLIFSSGLRPSLGPRLNHAASKELLALSLELDSIVLSPNSLDQRLCRRTNKLLSNKDFYSIAFTHLQIDDLAG